jgi:hypothetical protein
MTRTVAWTLVCWIPLAALLASCGAGSSDASFYPLDEGRNWTYRVTKNLDEATESDVDSLSFTMKGAQTLESGPAQRRHSSNGLDYFLRSDDQGIYRVGSRDALEVNLKGDNPPRFVLKKPFVVGTQWQASTMPYVLQRRNEFPKEVRYTTKPIMMVYAIVALDQKVETPAGQFVSCIKVLGEAKIRLYVDAAFNWREVPLFTTEWYCPGIGLARMERVETSPSKFMRGGSVTMDLVSYK